MDYAFTSLTTGTSAMNFPRIHIFVGDEGSMQMLPFIGAMDALGSTINRSSCELMTFSKLKDLIRFKQWTQDTFLKWLRDADIYIIICHIHQGFAYEPLRWDPVDFYQKLYDNLKGRIGFPSGEGLRCPIFTQNKVEYIAALADIMNPTSIVPIAWHYDYSLLKGDIEE